MDKIVFIFEADVGGAIKNACLGLNNWDSNAIHLARAADIVRKDICEHRDNFNGFFLPKCKENAVPQSLIALVSMLLQVQIFKIRSVKIKAKYKGYIVNLRPNDVQQRK